MTEFVLPYDHRITPQETGYWCGPASTQVILNSRGIILGEPGLAKEIGTNVGGTNSVDLIVPVLNKYSGGRYVTRNMPNDPPTPNQCEQLWRDAKTSIDGGFGVVANIDAPPSNYPIGVKGSSSPLYGGGEVFHYFALMGYDDGAERAFWVADSGFSPFGYWIGFEQLCSLIPPKAYAAFVDAPSAIDQDGELWRDNLLQFLGE